MGGAQSVEVPGGGSEGYHVLKVCNQHKQTLPKPPIYINFPSPSSGPGELARLSGWPGGVL